VIKDIQHILPLRKESITKTLNMHTDEVMQFTKVFHGELLLES
jgi:predicted transcriptional regulator